jgi:hypothetical protein
MPKSSPQWQGKHRTHNPHIMTTLQGILVQFPIQELWGNIKPSLVAHFRHIVHFIFTRILSLLAKQGIDKSHSQTANTKMQVSDKHITRLHNKHMYQLDKKSYQNMAKICKNLTRKISKAQATSCTFLLPILACKMFTKVSRNILKSHRNF